MRFLFLKHSKLKKVTFCNISSFKCSRRFTYTRKQTEVVSILYYVLLRRLINDYVVIVIDTFI